MIQGLLNKQIAWELGTAEKTVKVHRARVMEKLAVGSVAELARLAERTHALRFETEPRGGPAGRPSPSPTVSETKGQLVDGRPFRTLAAVPAGTFTARRMRTARRRANDCR